MKINTKNSESGRSLIELLGVLAIMGMITAAAFVLIRGGMATQKRTVVNDDVAEIVTGVRTLYADYDTLPSSFDGARTLAALSIDDEGPYTGSKYSVSRKSGTRFEVKITGLPKNECTVLETKAWSGAVDQSATCSSTTLTIQYDK